MQTAIFPYGRYKTAKNGNGIHERLLFIENGIQQTINGYLPNGGLLFTLLFMTAIKHNFFVFQIDTRL